MKKEEFNWTEKPVIGLSLLVMGGAVDSYGNGINGDIYYEVGKHKKYQCDNTACDINHPRIPDTDF